MRSMQELPGFPVVDSERWSDICCIAPFAPESVDIEPLSAGTCFADRLTLETAFASLFRLPEVPMPLLPSSRRMSGMWPFYLA